MSNYRPISLLPTFSKILEKLTYKRLLSHLNKYNILVKEQFGFRENYSTALATYKLLDNIYTALNNKCIVGGIFCDLRKASDCVSHDILLSKMEFYGIKGTRRFITVFTRALHWSLS
jgi:phosphoenolpyruvate carboxylase